MPPKKKANVNSLKKASKKKNGYDKPEPIPRGDVLVDLSKKKWVIGPVIGAGGFGEIYAACSADNIPKNFDDYSYVVKIEPHGNGPLFVEMHFYMRNSKLEDVESFCKKRGLKSIGIPYLIGSGSHEVQNIKHRFIVLPRYGKDIWSFFIENGRKLPLHTIFRLAIQMLDAYEYIHGSSYVHGDLKGTNILLGYGKATSSQSYLLDFGLATHFTKTEFKPDPKKMHNGTIEYTSRDAHNGVPTMRGDMEILGYNLIQWSGRKLPWENESILSNPINVKNLKENFMNDEKILNEILDSPLLEPIKKFIIYVQKMKYNDTPDYVMCRKIFLDGLKVLKKTNVGALDFVMKSSTPKVKHTAKTPVESKSQENLNTSRIKRKRGVENKSSPEKKSSKKDTKLNSTPISININTNSTKCGSTIVNNQVTPNKKSGKVYELNFELDVSLDANVIVNVKRNKKPKNSKQSEEKDKAVPSTSFSPRKSPRTLSKTSLETSPNAFVSIKRLK